MRFRSNPPFRQYLDIALPLGYGSALQESTMTAETQHESYPIRVTAKCYPNNRALRTTPRRRPVLVESTSHGRAHSLIFPEFFSVPPLNENRRPAAVLTRTEVIHL